MTFAQVIQDYDTVFDNSIPFRKNDPLRITYFRIPGVPGLHLCLGTEAAGVSVPPPVTGAAADEYNLNVVDCNASVTVARRSSISVSGGPAAGGKRKMVFRGPRACWKFIFYKNIFF